MIRLSEAAFEPGDELDRFARGRSETGAIASFLGLARRTSEAGVALELEAYPGFTEREIEVFARAAKARFGLQDLAIVHRIGPIQAGEAIVLVMTAAAHRREAFEACDFLMDYLKSKAPFWKKEFGPEGARWVEPTAADLADIRRWD